MLQVVSTGAYYPPVYTTWKILTTGASQLTAGALCTGLQVNAQRRFVPGEVVKHLVGMRFAISRLANLSEDQMLNFVTQGYVDWCCCQLMTIVCIGTNCSLDPQPMPAILASPMPGSPASVGPTLARRSTRSRSSIPKKFLSLKDSCKTKH